MNSLLRIFWTFQKNSFLTRQDHRSLRADSIWEPTRGLYTQPKASEKLLGMEQRVKTLRATSSQNTKTNKSEEENGMRGWGGVPVPCGRQTSQGALGQKADSHAVCSEAETTAGKATWKHPSAWQSEITVTPGLWFGLTRNIRPIYVSCKLEVGRAWCGIFADHFY